MMEIIGVTLMALGVLVALMAVGFKIFYRYIPNEPPHVALITFLGERGPWKREDIYWLFRPFIPKKLMKREGWRFFIDFWPLFYDYIPIKIVKINKDFTFENVRCRAEEKKPNATKETDKPESGGELAVKIGLTIRPDYVTKGGERLNQYIESGGEEGVLNIIREMIEEDVRQTGREKDWESFSFATDELMVYLVKKLTGKEPKPEQDTDAFLKSFRQELYTNGFPDVIGLGIIVTRFNVGKIKEEGDLAKVAEARAKEIQERRAEIYEIGTEIQQANQILVAYKEAEQEDKTLEDCLLEIRRRKAIREGHGAVWDISGLDKIKSLISIGGKND